MTGSCNDTSKANALHLDDFSVKQKAGQQSVPKYYGEALLAAAIANKSILALTAAFQTSSKLAPSRP